MLTRIPSCELHDREILHALPNHKRLRSCGLFPSSLERSEISDMRSHAAPDVLAVSMQPPSTSSIVVHISSVRFASPHAISCLNGPCDMVFSIVGLSGWILHNGLLHHGAPRHDFFLRGILPNGFLSKGFAPMVSPVIAYSIVGLPGMISCSMQLSRPVFSIAEVSNGVLCVMTFSG